MSNEPKTSKKSSRFKWLRRLIVALVIYTIVGFWVVPAMIKSQMLKQLPALTKRQATIEKVKFNPYALSLTIEGLALKETNGEMFSSFDEFYANFQLWDSLIHLAWVFDDIHLQKPFAQVTYGTGGIFNFANLIGTNAPAKTNSPPNVLPSLIIHSLSISNGAIAIADLTRPTPFRTKIIPIDLSLTNLATIRDRNSPYIFQAHTASGESFAWSGSVSLNPLSSAGRFRMSGLPLREYSSYSHEYGRFDLLNGVVGMIADYHFASSTNGLDFSVSNGSMDISRLALTLADNGTRFGFSNFLAGFTFNARSLTGQPMAISLTNVSVQLAGIHLESPQTNETVLAVQNFLITNLSANLSSREANIGLIQSSGGLIQVRQEQDGKINLLSLIPAKTHSASAAPINPNSASAEKSAPFALRIDEIAVEEYAVHAEDKKPATAAEMNVDQISVILKGVSNQTNTLVTAAVSLRLQGSGDVRLNGTATLLPPSADVQVGLTNIDLRAIQPYLEQQIKLALISGTLDLQGHARYAPLQAGAPLVSFTGGLAITKLATADDVLFREFAKWDSLNVDGIDIQLQPDKFKIDRVKFTGLNSSLIIGPDHRANLQTILRDHIAAQTNGAKPAANQGAAATAVDKTEVALGTLAFENASLHFSDQSIEPHSAFDVQEFGGEITGLSSQPDSVANIDIRGKVDGRSPFSISGKANPLGHELVADIAVAFTNTDLTAFTPYTEKFVGRPLNKGKFSFGVHYVIQSKNLQADNGFYVDQLMFGPKNDSTNATSLPVKLAVALLKDRQGRIEMNVPVSGRLDDPKFKLGPIIWQVINNLIVKAVTSPFSLLGSMFGGGPELSFVNFSPGETAIPDTETNKVNSLAKALFERPELTLELNGSVNPDLDKIPLARAKLEQRLKSRFIKEESDSGKPVRPIEQVRLDATTRTRLLLLEYQQTIGTNAPVTAVVDTDRNLVVAATNQPPVVAAKLKNKRLAALMSPKDEVFVKIEAPIAVKQVLNSIPPAQLEDLEPQLLDKIILTQDDWRELMKLRAMAVQEYLLKTGKVTADRLFITAPKPMSATSTGEDKVNLTLD